MRAFAAYVKGACHTSYSAVQSLFNDVFDLPVSRGYLTKVIQSTSGALQEPYEELRATLAGEPWLNVDETGHKDRGKKMWTWCFRARNYAVFRIDSSRGSDVLREVLGELFGGVLGADYMAAYQKYASDSGIVLQLCLAHLIRDVRYLITLPDKVTQNYGRRVVEALRTLFHTLHRRERLAPARYERAMRKAKADLIATARRAPDRTEAQNIAKRFRANATSYFTFMDVPGVEPTNNRAEQAIRHVVIDRRVTQGTRGSAGQRWCERIWTTLATCAEQGRTAFAFLEAAIRAKLAGQAAPSLLPAAAMASGP
jgi:transposase